MNAINAEEQKNPNWRYSSEIELEISSRKDVNLLRDAAALRTFVQNALFAADYRPAAKWSQMVKLTIAGEAMLKLINFSDDIDQSDISMAAFSVFYHHDSLIDCDGTDLKGIQELLNTEILSGQLRLAHRFGRLLYDKFNETYKKDRTDHLLPDEASALITGTPQGVYQVGRFVSGPLGILVAPQLRYIPPSRAPNLWHCSDPGCQAPHSVDLLPTENAVVRLTSRMREMLKKTLGPASEWGRALANLMGRDVSSQPYTYFDVTAVIADCVVGDERAALLSSAINGQHGTKIRDVLSAPPRRKRDGQGPAEALAKNLSSEEQLQLLFLLENSYLVEVIDKCVKHKTIFIPLGELRVSKNVPPHSGRTATSEICSSGIRCPGKEPLVDLCSMLWEAYNFSGRINELDWRLRNRTGFATQNALLSYLSDNEPALAVRDLVLASEIVTKGLCERLSCAVEDVNSPQFTESLLSKFGFNIPRFDEALPVLRRRLDAFNHEILQAGALGGEPERERVRGAGVNLFVSIEEFLERIVAYNVWVLASDHFLGTHFEYDLKAARQLVPKILGDSVLSGHMELNWNSAGSNTLGVLMAYLNCTVVWLKGLPATPHETLLRPAADLPHFAEDRLRIFPFRHTALWADSNYSCLESIIGGFTTMVTRLAQSNLANIRNGLDHQRDEANFPKVNEMLAFVAHFREAVEIADVGRYFPKEFWLESYVSDRFDRSEFSFKDYLGRSHAFFGPTFVHGVKGPSFREPIIIAPGNLLGYANAEIIFTIRERSTYSEYWQGFPRRRRIPNDEGKAHSPGDENALQDRGSVAGVISVSSTADLRPVGK